MQSAPTSKREFYQRYDQGEFGNRPRSWRSTMDLALDTYAGPVTVRSLEIGGVCRYQVPKHDAVFELRPCRFNESMPDDRLLLQGEVMRSTSGLYLAYSTVRGQQMRAAMEHPRHAERSVAAAILRDCLWPSSHDDVMRLLDDYDAVVEFSAYDRAVGDHPLRNAVIWEVRNY